jgi:hypothetical protein
MRQGRQAGLLATKSRRSSAGSTTAGCARGSQLAQRLECDTLVGDDLHFSPVGTFDLRLFANPGDIPEVAVKRPWLRGTQIRFEVNNIFDSKPWGTTAGNVPLNYQPDLLRPLGTGRS